MRTILLLAFIFSTSLFASVDEDIRVLELKGEILNMAKSFEGKTDLDGKLQDQLEDKVNQLERLIPFKTMEEKWSYK